MRGDYDQDRLPARLWLIPILSTAAGSSLSLVPLVVQTPILPPFGLLVALAWRLLRAEMWGAWVALPLGLIDDLIGGAPLGTAMTLWTVAFLGLDIADHRIVWRDLWTSWQLAIFAIGFCGIGAWGLAWLAGGAGPLWTIAPQSLLAILCFPAAMRMVSAIDRWRLGKGAATSG
ncbi:rod shape-determining protein MreD [Sphingomonas bacterium]|uniref:rod shape-determining protein MreD n=1 Tax=Sphingomonas bacterium TaxID=1895847 RepID=UPI001576EA05|nr:rod shape-determining protein MreD [Sphingomonas bacterium]